jgi:flagellar biosynthetic protein FliR
MGLMVNLTVYALQMAGYFFDVPLGFGMVNLIDPQSGGQTPLFSQFNYIFAGLIFMAVNGHHTLIFSFIKSYQVVQPGMFFLKKEAVGVFLQAFAMMFFLGFKIGIPVIGTIFLVDVAMGMISKLIPQINVFVVGFSLKIAIGLFILAVFMPTYVFMVEQAFSSSGWVYKMLQMMLRNLTG